MTFITLFDYQKISFVCLDTIILIVTILSQIDKINLRIDIFTVDGSYRREPPPPERTVPTRENHPHQKGAFYKIIICFMLVDVLNSSSLIDETTYFE